MTKSLIANLGFPSKGELTVLLSTHLHDQESASQPSNHFFQNSSWQYCSWLTFLTKTRIPSQGFNAKVGLTVLPLAHLYDQESRYQLRVPFEGRVDSIALGPPP